MLGNGLHYHALSSDLVYISLITSYSFYRIIRCLHIHSLEDPRKICWMSQQDPSLYPLLLHYIATDPVAFCSSGTHMHMPTCHSFPLEASTLKTKLKLILIRFYLKKRRM